MWSRFFRSREESHSCAKTVQQSSLNVRRWSAPMRVTRDQQPRGGRGQGSSSHSPWKELGPPETQGSSNYGDKDILELDSLYSSGGTFSGSDLGAKGVNHSRWWTVSNRTGDSLQVLIAQSKEEASYLLPCGSTTVLLLSNKEEAILYHFRQLSFKPVSETSLFC